MWIQTNIDELMASLNLDKQKTFPSDNREPQTKGHCDDLIDQPLSQRERLDLHERTVKDIVWDY